MKNLFTLIFLTLVTGLVAKSSPVKRNTHFSGPSANELMRSNLYIVGTDGTPTLVDGDLTQYDPSYSNTVDGMDARKISNFSENIGMLRSATVLVIERRKTIETADTIFYKMWNLKKINYQLQFITSNLNHPGLSGYLEDGYLHQNTPLDLNGLNTINFSVTSDPASADIYRFRIIFSTASPARLLPLTFTSVKAVQQNNTVTIDWQTSNETNINQYTIERSSDGSHYFSMDHLTAYNSAQNNYSWNDNDPLQGYSFYRIISVGINGEISNSTALKIYTGNQSSAISVFPNPVINFTINLKMGNQLKGDYIARLFNSFGQLVIEKTIHHNQGSPTESFDVPHNIIHGIYHIEITSSGVEKNSIKIIL